MSDFILDGEDYIDMIKTDDDLKMFHRMKEIWESGDLAKPAKECYELVIEFDNMRQDLHREKRHTFIFQKSHPKLN